MAPADVQRQQQSLQLPKQWHAGHGGGDRKGAAAQRHCHHGLLIAPAAASGWKQPLFMPHTPSWQHRRRSGLHAC